jgi:hypothetical protein
LGCQWGPALSGVFQETFKGTAQGISGFFPTDHAYNIIFVTATLVSLASVVIALSASRIATKEQQQ